ncbi:MAG: hypothetical protein J6O73_10070, partial [Lachnospiraceae bacterium]|nr:hypothetical protein [Lachnospiraceae bacterium]
PLDWVCTSGQRCNSIVKEDPFLCNCQCAMPPDQRYGHHIEFVIDPFLSKAMILMDIYFILGIDAAHCA